MTDKKMIKKYNLQEIHEENFRTKVHSVLKNEIQNFSEKNTDKLKKINSCPACKSTSLKSRFECLHFHYDECMECYTLFINPYPTEDLIVEFLNSSEGLRIWREEMPPHIQESRKKLYSNRAESIINNVKFLNKENITLLEIGGGRGELAKELAKETFIHKIYVVEPQGLHINISNIEVIRNTFQEIDLINKVDMVVAFEVFEHILDPLPFLKKAFECLNPGGILILTTPNGKSLEVDLLNEQSTQVPFDHVRLYNPLSLQMMLEKSGFTNVEISTPGMLDVEILEREINQEKSYIQNNHMLKFILETESNKLAFQEYIVRKCISSHMNAIAHKPFVAK